MFVEMAEESGRVTTPGLMSLCKARYEGADVQKTISCYDGHFAKTGKEEDDFDYQSRKEKYYDITQRFYILVTDFYEYGYGTSFHFAPVLDGKSFAECIHVYEEGIALTLKAKPGMKILDAGCGVGGPACHFAHVSGANVVGVNHCQYQIQRAKKHTEKAGFSNLISYIHSDFCNMDIPDNTLDGAYTLESTVHSKSPLDVYREIFRVLKPGAIYVDSAWATTDSYDPSNPEHVRIKSEIEYGNGIPQLRTQKEVLAAMKEAGFEIMSFKNVHHEGDKPWYVILQGRNVCSMQNFRMSNVGRWTTHFLLSTLETLRIVPQGMSKVHNVLLVAADSLVEGGRYGIFTPFFRIAARKPLTST